MIQNVNTESFIHKAKLLHGDKYDYSLVNYLGFKSKIKIICRIHGEFEQRPDKHIQGCGCQICGKEKISKGNRSNTESFILKAKKIHGDQYDYSKSVYCDSKKDIKIICHVHGEFNQNPNNHLFGKGCPSCNGRRDLNQWFIDRAKKIHGDKYDYSLVKYINSEEKVSILCPIHGEFRQSATLHLTGYGCFKCSCTERGEKQRMTLTEFVEKATEIYKGEYDYSKVNYLRSSDKVIIICHKHGEFEQTPNSHLSGHRCPYCSAEKRGASYRVDTKNFIERAKKIHGDRFDYSKFQYVKNYSKTIIICPEHGEFITTPCFHLGGGGCPKCGDIQRRKSKTLGTDRWIVSARKIHGELYDYSKVNYKHSRQKVVIGCRVHGDFEQTPNKHLQGRRCPHCKESNWERSVRDFLKENNISFEAQKRFSWLLPQSLDFFLPKQNIAIEVQGIQHFKPTDFQGAGFLKAEVAFTKCIAKDIQKNRICLENGIQILYFSEEEEACSMFGENIIKDKETLLSHIRDI